MLIELELTDGNRKRVKLIPIESSSKEENIEKIWVDEDSNLLTIKQYYDGVLDIYSIGENVSTNHDEIIDSFIEQEKDVNYLKNIGIEPTDDEDVDQEEPQPYDPELIRVDTKNFSVYQVYELIRDNELDLSPDFQRHFVWKEIGKKSRLIESMMLRIPLPVFYLSQDNEGKFQVIDGLQRLTVIKDYLENNFKLKKLEYLAECENCFFNTQNGGQVLGEKFTRRIKQTSLMINIIDPQTPPKVKFEIFKRINEGGKPLKPQEIRNCMASVRTRKLLNELADSDEFKNTTNNGISNLRMEDQEVVLRFIAFYYNMIIKNNFNYKGWMNGYLDDMLNNLNSESNTVFNILREAFLKAMRNSYFLFGQYSFRKVTLEHLKNKTRMPLINKSLFTTWAVLLADYDIELIKIKISQKGLIDILAKRLNNDTKYFDAVTSGTSDVKNIVYSFTVAKEIITNQLQL